MVAASKGVTLIELVIVIAIIGISAVAIIPFGASWVAKTQVEKTQKMLIEAYNKATTEAIKNPNSKKQTDTDPMVAKLTITSPSGSSEGVINVKASDSTTLWSAKFPASVTVTLNASSGTCPAIELNNNAGLIGTTCTGGYTISRSGVSNVTITAQF
ncbi:type II secretion system protein [Acinetobacter albensis]|uniref:pilus assembly FimT family protein n=1 Tax=Acinetobacter albensis TaxID=1673609 RepID=UPI00187FA8C0|nr:type II secretion system protein [Acinetobacter albensis]MBE9399767.1 type II secretion system protein [Acinetobacter albensis]